MHWVGCELHLSGWASRHARSSIMTPGRGPAASARGRPRDPTLDARILDQVLALLASHGYAGLTLDELASRSGVAKTTIPRRRPAKPAAPGPARLAPDALASRSGVAKTTILRRWPSKAAVAAAGVERLAPQSVDVPGSGAVRGGPRALRAGGWCGRAAGARPVAPAGVERRRLPHVDVPDSGTLRGDLHALLHAAVDTFARGSGQFVPRLLREAGHPPPRHDLPLPAR